jgi:hypothetical protein
VFAAEAEAEVWHFITLAFLKWEMKVRQESRPDPSGLTPAVLTPAVPSATDPSGFASDFWFGGSISGRIVVTASRICPGTCLAEAAAREALENGLNEQRQPLSSQIAEKLRQAPQTFMDNVNFFKSKIPKLRVHRGLGGIVLLPITTDSASAGSAGGVDSGEAKDGESEDGAGALGATGGNAEDPDNNRKDNKKDKNRGTEGEKPASDKTGKDFGRRIGKDLGEDAKKEFHDMKEKGAPDRSLNQLKQDASDLYRQAGKDIPNWLK